MGVERDRLGYTSLLTFLIVCAIFLTARLIYLFLADVNRFPINTVKVVADYQYITRQQLEQVLSNYIGSGFFSLSTQRLQTDLLALDWAQKVHIERVWPDTLKLTLVEKSPIAIWNDELMIADGKILPMVAQVATTFLPKLKGPKHQQLDVLHIYQKLSKLLELYGLHAASLELRENQAWELFLTNGIQLRLGKRNLEERLQRFCRAYPVVFADKPEQLSSVDLRYARGMAVLWKTK